MKIYRVLGFMAQVRNSWVLGFGVIVIMVLDLGKYMTMTYLDP